MDDLLKRRMEMVKEGPDLSNYTLVDNVYIVIPDATVRSAGAWYSWYGIVPVPITVYSSNLRVETSVKSSSTTKCASCTYIGLAGLTNSPTDFTIFRNYYECFTNGTTRRTAQMYYNNTYYSVYGTKSTSVIDSVDYFDTSITTNNHCNLVPYWCSSVTYGSSTSESTYTTGKSVINGKVGYNNITLQNGSNSGICTSMRIRYSKIWNGGVLVSDLRAAKRKSDNRYGLLDMVSGYFIDCLKPKTSAQSPLNFSGQD